MESNKNHNEIAEPCYPELIPFHSDLLQVSDIHQVAYEECGNPQGIPLLFLHGGPGNAVGRERIRECNPALYRIILLDQRGCGRSLPFGELRENNTHALISDCEKLRKQLNIEKWLVMGGSWGSTLSLAYAEAHPESVIGLILLAIFLGRTRDEDWLFQEGANQVFPEAWEEFISYVDQDQRHDMVSAYRNMLDSHDEPLRHTAAQAWWKWEATASHFYLEEEIFAALGDENKRRSIENAAQIENYYFNNHCFLEPNQLLRDIGKITHIPTIIIHGRYDMCCPMKEAFELKKALPNAHLVIIPDAGHYPNQATKAALMRALDQFSETRTFEDERSDPK